MNSYGPGDGREKNPEDIAQDIMNQSDEGIDDLLEGTEIYEDDDDEPMERTPAHEEDDGGDYSE